MHPLDLGTMVFIMYVSVCGYVHVNVGAGGNQKRASGPLELWLQVVVAT